MTIKRGFRLLAIALCLCLAAGAGLFLNNAFHSYNIGTGFTLVPLNYNPEDSSSRYEWNGAQIVVYGGFIKGIRNGGEGSSLVVRALSPLPLVEIKTANLTARNLRVTIENINPDYYVSKIDKNLYPSRIAVNALQFALNAGETMRISPAQPDGTEEDSYIILGDSRDGYETFDKIISQVNELKPVFVIDNGDLVYSGKPNQYRLFDQMVSGVSATLCTTLGNHDIRFTGRNTYQKLYGPDYYSFNFGNNHFIFLDSSRGYAEKQAIPEEQYAWLEQDLQKAQGKRIFVISHVPPTDPRSGLQKNDIEAYADEVKQEGGFVEQKLEQYSENESIDHGFRNKQEAFKFENLMTTYHVDTVYLSHIHSYFNFEKNGVRYIISGGAGAELLTQGSYYHYLIAKTGTRDSIVMVQLPSPNNLLLQRYAASVTLFAKAIYKENQTAVSLFLAGITLLLLLFLILLYLKLKERLAKIWTLFTDTGSFMATRRKELFKSKS